jgi:N-succinyldiaminopimelate aminotransferase
MNLITRAITSPGDTIIVLSPYWPLIKGIFEGYDVKVVEVRIRKDRQVMLNHLEAALRYSRHVAAIYINTPCNPTGDVFDRETLQAIADMASESEGDGVYVISDEVYEDYVYEREHVSMGSIYPHTISVYSFSKAYGMAGNRVGYIAGPAQVVNDCTAIQMHTYYSAPTPGQHAAYAALTHGTVWQARARAEYAETLRQAADVLGMAPPAGGQFLWVPMPRDCVQDLVERGVLVTPGSVFGSECEPYVRMSATSVPRPDVIRGSQIMRDYVAGLFGAAKVTYASGASK